MSFNRKNINFKAGLDTSEVATGAQKIEGHMSRLNKSVTSISNQFKSFGTAVAGAFAVGTIINFAKNATLLAEETATAKARIDNIAKSMGLFGEQTANVTAAIKKYAEDNEILLATDRNVIMQTQAKLLTFKELAKTAGDLNGAFNRATNAAIDMAAAGFGEATQNAVQLGKALNDPIKGITALTRSGITFTEQEKEKIKTLVESNRILEAQDMVLKAIETQVGGTAEATADASVKINLHFKSIARNIGEILLPALEKFSKKLENIRKHGTAIGLRVSVADVEQYEGDAQADAKRVQKQLEGKNVAEKYAIIQKQLNNAQKEYTAIVYEDAEAAAFRSIYYGKQLELFKAMMDEFTKANSPTIEPEIISEDAVKKIDNAKTSYKGLIEPIEAVGKALSESQVFALDQSMAIDKLNASLTQLPESLALVEKGLGRVVQSPFRRDFEAMMMQIGQMIEDLSIQMTVDFLGSIGEAIVGVEGTFKSFGEAALSTLGRFFKTIGSMFIAFGIAQYQFAESLATIWSGASAGKLIAAGAALAVVGGAIGGLATKFGQTGDVGGSAAGVPSNNFNQGYNFESRLDGYDLVLVSDRNQRLRTRRG
jgi:hypothetical protein